MARYLLPLVAALAAAIPLAGCGGKSAAAKAEQAAALLRDQTIPGADGPMHPTRVRCDKQESCTVAYPDGQVQDCSVSISGNDQSVSCDVDMAATNRARARNGDPNAARLWAGTWKTRFGALTLQARGGRVTGSYENCSGKLQGIATGDGFKGTWTEDKTSCKTSRTDPSTFAGTFAFTMSPDRDSFHGTWAYRDESQDPPDVTWNGARAQ
jgi:hypothetical protein